MNGWIKINEHKPKHKQRVLVCFIDAVHLATWHKDNTCCQVATYKVYQKASGFDLECEGVNGYLSLTIETNSVTYWMPLPEPPQ